MSNSAAALETKAIERLKLGVEGLLRPGAKVFYENVFSTRHIGRVMDFVLFETRSYLLGAQDVPFLEYRVRQILELAIFNAWSGYRRAEKSRCVELEFGFDEERLVLAVAYYAEGDLAGAVPGSADKPASSHARRARRMLEQVQRLADGLVVRHDSRTGRVQLVVFVSRGTDIELEDRAWPRVDYGAVDSSELGQAPEGVDPLSLAVPKPLAGGEITAFAEDEKKTGPDSAGSFAPEETQVLSGGTKDGSDAKVDAQPAILGKVRVESVSERASHERVVVKGGTSERITDIQKVKTLTTDGPKPAGFFEDSGDSRTIHSTLKEDDFLFGMGDAPAATVTAAASEKPPIDQVSSETQKADGVEIHEDGPQIKLGAEETAAGVRMILDTVKSGMADLINPETAAQFEAAFGGIEPKIEENYRQAVEHLLRVKNVQLMTKLKHLQSQIDLLEAQADGLRSDNRKLILEANEAKHEPRGPETVVIKAVEKPIDIEALTRNIEANFQKKMAEYKKSMEAAEVPPSAQSWANGFMEDLLKDRAELNEQMNENERRMRRREHELKVRETTLSEALRQRDEAIRQRDLQLSKNKEALANALSQLDAQRGANTGDGAATAELSTKLATSQRMVAAAKEASERLQRRTEELQAKLQEETVARANLQQLTTKQKRQLDDLERKLADKAVGQAKAGGMELQEMTAQRDRGLRVIDELKGQMKELQAKITQLTASNKAVAASATDPKQKAAQSSEVELRHKLEQSGKMVKAMKDELERTRKRFDEVKHQETALRVEVTKLQAQIKTLKKSG